MDSHFVFLYPISVFEISFKDTVFFRESVVFNKIFSLITNKDRYGLRFVIFSFGIMGLSGVIYILKYQWQGFDIQAYD